MTKGNKVNEIITNKVIDMLKNNDLKWLKDWSLGFGCNYVTRKEYKGINALLINMSLQSRGYEFNEWITFNQLKQVKGTLNKGAKSTQVIFFQIKEFCSCSKKDCDKFKSGKDAKHFKKSYPILRYYNVFNISDTDLKSKSVKQEVKPLAEIERLINNYWDLKTIRLGNPSYSPSLDVVNMPKIHNFGSKESYYSTLMHELAHSTGHKDRLNRKGITEKSPFGSSTYAYEELIAELTSAFSCSFFGIEKDIKNTSAYIQSWLKALENDSTFIFKASAEAQKAQEYLKGRMTLKSPELVEAVKKSVSLVREGV